MKRTLLASTFSLLAGAATVLLLASIFYSCRRGGDPHHERSSMLYDVPEQESHSEFVPQTEMDEMRPALAHGPSLAGVSSDPAATK
jgi:hypothetical protein